MITIVRPQTIALRPVQELSRDLVRTSVPVATSMTRVRGGGAAARDVATSLPTSARPDRTVRETSAALRDLCRAVSDAETTLARSLGLGAGEYRAVKHVLYARHALGVTELAKHLGYSKGTTSELVMRLVERGFVEREQSAVDARRVALRATDEAVAEVHGALGAMFSALAGVASTKDAATLRTFTSFLREAAAAVTP